MTDILYKINIRGKYEKENYLQMFVRYCRDAVGHFAEFLQQHDGKGGEERGKSRPVRIFA
jgi:hypothetical protein